MTYKKRTVILVDDDEDFLAEFREALALSGYIPLTLRRAYGLLRLAKKALPAAIFMDVRLGRLNGADMAEKLRLDPVTAPIPVIMMSGYFRSRGSAKKGAGANVIACLEKPFRLEDAVMGLRALLGGREREPGGLLFRHSVSDPE